MCPILFHFPISEIPPKPENDLLVQSGPTVPPAKMESFQLPQMAAKTQPQALPVPVPVSLLVQAPPKLELQELPKDPTLWTINNVISHLGRLTLVYVLMLKSLKLMKLMAMPYFF